MIDNLFLISDKEFWHQIDEKHSKRGGVYKLVAAKDGKRIPVQRWLDNDEEGILYIGRATSFLIRVINLKKSIDPTHKDSSHKAGIRYKPYRKLESNFLIVAYMQKLLESESPGDLKSGYCLNTLKSLESYHP